MNPLPFAAIHDHFHFHDRARNQPGHLDRRAGGTGRRKELVPELPEFAQVIDVLQIHGEFDDVVENRPGFLQDVFNVLEDPDRLSLKVFLEDLSLFITRRDPRKVEDIPHFHCL